jgi:uncharacterized membrane protein
MLAKRSREIAKEMKEQNKQYRIGNKSYLIFPLTIFALLGTFCFWLSNLLTSRPGIDSFFIFIIWIIVIFFQNIKRKKKEIIVSVFIGTGFAAFLYFVSIRGGVEYINLMWFLYFMLIALSVFSSLIDNVTEDGRRLTAHIKGFKRYMQTAEKYRAELSDPTNAEKIFCDYLPYAFAFDIENKWMKTFENILSASVMERSLSYVGGAHAVSSGSFMSGLNSSLSSSGSGAGGGGSSGGGSGGGGGGGR